MQSQWIYRKDANDGVRVWCYEVEGDKYRTYSGVEGGSITPSAWTVCVGKQGRSNAEQAAFEANAMEKQKLDREYRRLKDELSSVPTSPMLAKKFEDEKERIYWIFTKGFKVYSQPKLDGIRAKITRAGAFSREFQRHLNVDHVLEELAPLFTINPDLELDGELYNHDFKDNFNKIASIVRKQKPSDADRADAREFIQYHIYDVPSIGAQPFRFRAKAMWEMFEKYQSKTIRFVPTLLIESLDDLDDAYGQYLTQGYEGQMIRVDAPYEFSKRSKFLLKRKEFLTAEFPLVGVEEGIGNWSGYAKRVLFALPDGRNCGAGIKGDQAQARKLLTEWPAWGDKKAVTIRYFTPTPDGMPRFPVAIDFHPEGRID